MSEAMTNVVEDMGCVPAPPKKRWWAPRVRAIKKRVLRWLLYDLAGDSNYLSHYEREFKYAEGDEGPDGWIREGTKDLLCILSMQGHSGGSIGYAVEAFRKMALFEPWGPLTGDDDEWQEVRDGIHQNLRCSHVFKDSAGAYDIEGRIFREPSGACFTKGGDRCEVTFPYTPTRTYIDVDEDGNEIKQGGE